MRLAVALGDVPAEVHARADLEAAEIDETRGADGGGHTFVATGRAELAGAISRPAE